jgi:uncharacterized delta-60 repeat protein
MNNNAAYIKPCANSRRLRNALTFILTSALFFYFAPLRAHAAAGDLDTSFGFGGKVVTDVSQTPDPFNPDSQEESAWDVAIQPDGKIIAAGFAINPTNGTSDFAVIRYNPDGSLDTSFGIGSQVLTDFNNSTDIAFAIALQADGRIVVAGLASAPNLAPTFAVARYTSNGELDQSFGTAGKVTVFFNKIHGKSVGALVASMIWDVAIQSDGKIVLAGDADAKFGLARLGPDGSIDLTFGTGGKTIVSLAQGSGGSAAYSVATQIVDSEERIVAAGYAATRQGFIDFALTRFRANGTLDNTFDGDGKVITDFAGGEDSIRDIVIDANNRIVAAGSCGSINFALARYNSDGTLDNTFDGDGKVNADFFGFFDQGNSVAIQPDGKIVVAGRALASDNFTSSDFALARYNPDGTLDNSFGTNGKLITDFSGQGASANALALQPDSKVVLLGTTYAGVASSFALARYLLE